VATVLRPLTDDDLDRLFVWENDDRAVKMAAFTRADSSDRSFDAHYHRIRDNPDNTVLAVDDDGVLVGTIGSFPSEVGREVTFWIDPGQWGRGLASAALRSFLDVEPIRPLFARVAEHNAGPPRCCAGPVSYRSAPSGRGPRVSAARSERPFTGLTNGRCAGGPCVSARIGRGLRPSGGSPTG
jgi:Acetyltransferase (GNAT) domain